MTGDDVVAEARTWLGVPYEHQGRSRHGVDCVGFVICVGRALGLLLPDDDVNGYARTPDGRTMLETCDLYMDRISAVETGCVQVWRFDQHPQHLGVVAWVDYGGERRDTLVQALAGPGSRGRVVESRIATRRGWAPVQAYRFRGVAP